MLLAWGCGRFFLVATQKLVSVDTTTDLLMSRVRLLLDGDDD